MECKKHKWRMGSGIGELTNKTLLSKGRNIWCERCGKKEKVFYFNDDELADEISRIERRRWKKPSYKTGREK